MPSTPPNGEIAVTLRRRGRASDVDLPAERRRLVPVVRRAQPVRRAQRRRRSGGVRAVLPRPRHWPRVAGRARDRRLRRRVRSVRHRGRRRPRHARLDRRPALVERAFRCGWWLLPRAAHAGVRRRRSGGCSWSSPDDTAADEEITTVAPGARSTATLLSWWSYVERERFANEAELVALSNGLEVTSADSAVLGRDLPIGTICSRQDSPRTRRRPRFGRSRRTSVRRRSTSSRAAPAGATRSRPGRHCEGRLRGAARSPMVDRRAG